MDLTENTNEHEPLLNNTTSTTIIDNEPTLNDHIHTSNSWDQVDETFTEKIHSVDEKGETAAKNEPEASTTVASPPSQSQSQSPPPSITTPPTTTSSNTNITSSYSAYNKDNDTPSN